MLMTFYMYRTYTGLTDTLTFSPVLTMAFETRAFKKVLKNLITNDRLVGILCDNPNVFEIFLFQVVNLFQIILMVFLRF